ncbi:MAG TPA: glycoside hydrolase family 3 N-terminal domain-containing protein [Propionibacteriaceae bacterium]|nr:glycoside hydrolase family 3 N-terminal domain-containing protein [Propionibacteriaceae bacterium]
MLDMGLTITVRLATLGLVSVLLGACAQVPVPEAPSTPAPPSPAAPTTSPVTAAPSESPTSAATPTITPQVGSACADLVARLTPAEQVGQLLMVAVSSTGLGGSVRDTLAESRAGSAILLGNSTAGAAVTRRVVGDVRDSTRRPGGIQTLLAVDQEGGGVQRLRGPGFTEIPSAEQQAERSDVRLTRDAERWGRELTDAGLDANLAPVADVVPADLGDGNAPIGALQRGYGSDPGTVAAKASAFVRGMNRAGVATAVKHFPGLGRVRGNTDFARRVVDRQTTRDGAQVAAYRSVIEARVDMVMVSSAYYERIDPRRRAAFSPVVLTDLLREDLGFSGVVISDDLAAAAMADVDPEQRALRFLGAGGDLMIIGDAGLVDRMAQAVRERMASDARFAERVRQSATRVVVMKARRGLVECAGSTR